MTSFFPVFYKFTTRSAISLVFHYSLLHSLRSAKYKRCSCVLVRDLTRGIQDCKLPDMVPKPVWNPLSTGPDFTMSEEPNIRWTTAPRRSTRYEVTHLETGSLASRSSAAFIRRRRHIQQEIQDTLQKLELHSKVMELRRALREEENNAIALSSCSPRQPSSTASNSKQPQPRQQQPASASRTLDSASVHSNILPDSDTPVLKHNKSTSTKLTTQQRYVSPPPHKLSTYRQKNGIKQEYECETGVSQPDARSAEGCDTPRRTRVRAVLIPFLTCTLDEHASQKLVARVRCDRDRS